MKIAPWVVASLLLGSACGGDDTGTGTGDGSVADGSTSGNGDGSVSGGDGGSGGDAAAVADAMPAGPDAYIPDPGTPLADRLVTTSLTVPNGVKAGSSSWRIWGSGSLRVAPVFTVPLANCETLIGYTGQDGSARAVRVSAAGTIVTTHLLAAGRELRGLAAEPDGHFGALLWDDPNNKIYLHRFTSAGAVDFMKELVNGGTGISGNIPDTFTIGDSRLDFGGDRYAATYHVHTPSQGGHEGETLKYVTTAGAETTAYAWGCSHSMSALVRYSPTAAKFMPACVTDCYPGTTGTSFSTDSIGGIYINRNKKVRDFDGGCNGRVAAELGGAAVAPTGWMLAFNGHQNTATNGQNSYSTSSMNQDVGLVSIAPDYTAGTITWLTTTTGNEADVTIERWTPDGDSTEQYLVGWSEPAASYKYRLARVSAAGAVLEGPIEVTANTAWGRRDDPMRAHTDGDVVWAWFPSPASTELKFTRVESGRTVSCPSF